MPLIPRLHLFELNDQPWVPSVVRERVQACLTLLWTLRVPVMQASSPAFLVSATLKRLLGPRVAEFTFVDFCAGAGGPTPTIERALNQLLATDGPTAGGKGASGSSSKGTPRATRKSPRTGLTNGASSADAVKEGVPAVDFVLTDIAPHRPAWAAAAARSAHLHYVADSVDAGNASATLLDHVTLSPLASAATATQLHRQKTFRLFFLAFHHMPNPVARAILHNTLATADGFGIFELQGRTLGEFIMVLLIGPLLWLIAPFFFWHDPLMLLLMYVVPIVPAILVFDGLVSCLRTRVGSEIEALIKESGASTEGWRLKEGTVTHTWPIGQMRWYVGVRE